MIDTVKIKIRGGSIMKPEYFKPEYRLRDYSELSKTEKVSKRPILNTFIYKSENKEVYMPRIEVYEKLDKTTQNVYSDISIEFSVPKMIYENNLEELSEDDLDKVVSTVIGKMKIAGIFVFPALILNSTIKYIHFGKNVFLPENITMKNIIDEVKVTSMGTTFDSTYRVFKLKNTDEMFHFYNSTKEYVVYDKIRDILNSKNKSHDKYKTEREQKIITENHLESSEVFRFELRLKHHSQIKSVIHGFLKKNKKDNVLFKDVFNEELWKTVLNNSWAKIINRDENNLAFIFDKSNSKSTIRALMNNTIGNTGHDLNKIIMTIGLGYISSSDGMKYFRKECARKFCKKTASTRLDNKIRASLELLESLEHPDSIQYVSNGIREFERITQQKISTML